ncbi:MAG: polysaccharide biosynthesis protein [Deltaproteobacteria bacterium]|nr:MAG: polysaccharide biosynthesis protein [Deltaproteobacteria bacterium]
MKNRILLYGTDLVLLAISFLLSTYWMHVEKDAIAIMILFLTMKIFFFAYYGLYSTILRFAGLSLAVVIIRASIFSTFIYFSFNRLFSDYKFPLGFFAMDFLLTTFFIGLVRFAPRYFSEVRRLEGSKRVMIYGAGDLGEDVVRKLLRNPEEYQMIGFIDDDLNKIGKRLHNIPIFGPIDDLSLIISKQKISELIIAISTLEGDKIRFITRLCRKEGISCRIVPSFPNMLVKEVNIKNIDIVDLLRREPKDLDAHQIRSFIEGKVILITGAGGSIGSEISRQCIRFGAKKLIFVDHSEYNLYSIKEEFHNYKNIRCVLLSVTQLELMQTCFEAEMPDVVFHAAAYKHVPLVEESPYEGVINNILGTMTVANLSEKYGVKKFVLISTDKAVRPTNIMGASKRVAELYIQNLNVQSNTEYISVRFGNVLGSSGSVIPKFIDQINKGGPVTVTHPDVTRYFMLTNEAVQLVMQAASIGNGGEIFILNMGRPVKISEMAEDLIFLAGRQPYKEIDIQYIGLRPGEKLYEELLHDEAEKKTQYENITIGKSTHVNLVWLRSTILSLLDSCYKRSEEEMFNKLKILVPEFMHAHFQVLPSEVVPAPFLKNSVA